MRTVDQILEHLKITIKDPLPWRSSVLIEFVPADLAKEFLKPDADTKDWTASPLTEEEVLEQMRSYMSFAWEKALNHRGISANRSIDKMRAWLWLLEDGELLEFAEADRHYMNYGAPILKKICMKYGFEKPDTIEARRMSGGLPCVPGCQQGCGSRE